MSRGQLCVRSCLWLFFNVLLCLAPFVVAMMMSNSFTLAAFHAITIKGELLLLGIGIGSVAIGEWVFETPEQGLGKVVLGLLFLLLVIAFFCYVETAKISVQAPLSATVSSAESGNIAHLATDKGLKIEHSLSLFGAISVCSFVCMLMCWTKVKKK